MLHDDIVNPAASQPSEETSGAFPLVEKGSLCFSGADDCWETHPSALTDTICVFQRSLPCCCSQLMKQHVCALKIVIVQRHSQIYQTNRSLFDKSTKIGTNIHYYTINIFRY